MGVDEVEPIEGIAEVDRLIKVVVTHQHLETGAGRFEIFILVVFEVVGISSSGSDSAVVMTETELDSETPTIGTEAGGGARVVAV